MTSNPAENPEPGFWRRLPLAAPLFLCLLFTWSTASAQPDDCSPPKPSKQLVLIIDDMGNQLRRGERALQLPGRITFAVIPYTPFAAQLAAKAQASGKEVMLHAPMSSLYDLPLGKGGLTTEHSKAEFRRTLAAALAEIPQAKGVNNHMGSELTQRRQQMGWLMQELRSRDLYFVDSRTSDKTVAATVAAEFNVPHLSRQVFLDNERMPEAIDARFGELLARLERESVAVGIGHPYPETISYLEQALPQLEARGIELVFVSEILPPQATPGQVDVTAPYSLTSTPCSAI